MTRYIARILATSGVPIGVALIIAVAILAALNPAFLAAQNLVNVMVQSSFILTIAVGMTFVIASGQIDLSVGGVLGVSAGVSVLVMMTGQPAVVGVLAGLCTGFLFGLLNGFLIARLGLTDFIVTIGTMGLAAGVLRLIVFFQPLRVPREEEGLMFITLARGTIAGIPIPLVIVVALIVVMEIVLQRSGFGRRVRAVGMSAAAGRYSGVNPARIRMMCYTLCGLLAGLAGVLLAARLASVPPALGNGYELQAIAAAVLGGATLGGGKGTVVGAAIASLLLGTISTGLQVIGVDPTWYMVIVGASILLAVGFYNWSARFVERRPSSP